MAVRWLCISIALLRLAAGVLPFPAHADTAYPGADHRAACPHTGFQDACGAPDENDKGHHHDGCPPTPHHHHDCCLHGGHHALALWSGARVPVPGSVLRHVDWTDEPPADDPVFPPDKPPLI